jgi:hypothetical protein
MFLQPEPSSFCLGDRGEVEQASIIIQSALPLWCIFLGAALYHSWFFIIVMPRCCCYYCCAIIFNTRYYYCYGDVGLLGLKLCNAVVFLLSLKCQLGLDLVRHKSICSSGSSNSAKHFFHTHARSSSVRLLQKVSFCNNNSRLVTAVSEARKKAESWRCSSSKKNVVDYACTCKLKREQATT